MFDSETLKNHIYKCMREQIKCDLTIGKTDEDLKPFTEKQINDYIKLKNANIIIAVNEMYEDYLKDPSEYGDTLETFAELDWYREYMEYF
jgi:hypothetical protein